MKTKLTPKQRKFAEEYVNTGNASEAYRRAYDVGKITRKDKRKVLYKLANRKIKTSTRKTDDT